MTKEQFLKKNDTTDTEEQKNTCIEYIDHIFTVAENKTDFTMELRDFLLDYIEKEYAQ